MLKAGVGVDWSEPCCSTVVHRSAEFNRKLIKPVTVVTRAKYCIPSELGTRGKAFEPPNVRPDTKASIFAQSS